MSVFWLTSGQLLLLSLMLIIGCTDSSTDALEEIQISICDNFRNVDTTSIEALYWDIMNGVRRVDNPGGVPTIKNPGVFYTHIQNNISQQPLLGFQYPEG